MQKIHLDSFYVIDKFQQHEQIRDDLLDLISKSESLSAVQPEAEVNIHRCDWHISKNFSRPWFTNIQDNLFSKMLDLYKRIGYDGFTIHEIWFQQYIKNSQHGWHSHSCNFTNVYYLELPEDTPKTLLINPIDQKTIIEIDVKEGDIVFFPSFVIHKAPINNSNKRKTIISFNTNVTYSDEIYGKNLGVNNAIF